MFAYTYKKKSIKTMNNRDALSYNLHHVKRTKSALKKKDSVRSHRKSVQFNEVVLEVFDLINENEPEDTIKRKPSYPKVIKSSLKKEKVFVPIRCSNTMFPKTVINEYNGEIINFNKKQKEEKHTTEKEDTIQVSIDTNIPEIVIIKNEDNDDKTLTNLSNNQKENSLSEEIATSVAETVITSVAPETNQINVSVKANTFPRRSRPNHIGHRRQSSVRLKCIY
ncbi:hypothetical protein BCR36DRAFT_588244 [Piromyces finnis]|uniref:Uncharacterized protein n=1 Tax=Piromyces finnis TaxID=1754191 RepID=A0A1Y1UPS0_9FUNG|nr:hypothetical protein BCR36DRAFT_588244 [Piromyces finnis]|eukprot:ORX39504.1 hypothetical protein BCR36DRAFT_588244 [Piromyces finnis]